jgi:hypothetical protein
MRVPLFLGFAFFATVAHAQAPSQSLSLPKGLVADAFKKADCSVEIDEVINDLEPLGELSGGLKLVEVYCWRAAYNFGSILFAVNPKEPAKARLLRFKTLGEKNRLIDTFQLSSPSYDEKTKLLGSSHKGRGVGDCGTVGEWRWGGKDFVLARYWNKDECDGEPFDNEDQPDRWLVYPKKKQEPQKKN